MDARADRRRFLASTGLGLAAFALPARIAEAFAQTAAKTESGTKSRAELLAEAWKGARARGVPLLVIRVPESEEGRLERGRAWGRLLELGDPEFLAELLLYEVACGQGVEARALVPELESFPSGDVLAYLLAPDGSRVQSLDSAPPPLPKNIERSTREDPLLRDWLVGRERSIHESFAASAAALQRRAKLEQSALTASEHALTEQEFLGNKAPTTERVRGSPAWAILEARRREGWRRRLWLHWLAEAALERLEARPPAGSEFAREEPDGRIVRGSGVEHAQNSCTAGPCGSAVTPPRSRWFLWFYSEAEREKR